MNSNLLLQAANKNRSSSSSSSRSGSESSSSSSTPWQHWPESGTIYTCKIGDFSIANEKLKGEANDE